MRQIFLCFCCCWCGVVLAQPDGSNTISGHVWLLSTPQSIQRGAGYNKDGSMVMHSNDPMAKVENNIIVAAVPLSFQVNLEPTTNATITQKEQTFLPYVLPIVRGSTIYFLNEDQFFHNIYSLTPGSKFNIGRRPPGSPYPMKIRKKGVIKLSCDIHSHMKAYILSLETPYFARVSADGSYELSGLPNGQYRIEVFVPGLEIQSQILELDQQDEQLNFNFTQRSHP